jgi:hypothetical protein
VSFDSKRVRVHAKVVKVLTGILGKHWVHVRDGSGFAETPRLPRRVLHAAPISLAITLVIGAHLEALFS